MQHRAHDCKPIIDALERRFKEAEEKIKRLKQELAEARSEKRQKVTPNVLGGYSNSIKAVRDYP